MSAVSPLSITFATGLFGDRFAAWSASLTWFDFKYVPSAST